MTSIPVSAPVAAMPLIETPSKSTVRPKPPVGPFKPTQGPATPAAVVQLPPTTSVSLVIAAGALLKVTVSPSSPLNAALNLMASVVPPAAHSPPIAPEAVLVLAATIALRSVQAPSLAAVSPVLLTVMSTAKADAGSHSRAATASGPARRMTLIARPHDSRPSTWRTLTRRDP